MENYNGKIMEQNQNGGQQESSQLPHVYKSYAYKKKNLLSWNPSGLRWALSFTDVMAEKRKRKRKRGRKCRRE